MHLYDIYRTLDPHAHGRVTVPVLIDSRGDCIVNNESKEIVRLLNEQCRHMSTRSAPDLYPEALRKTIDDLYVISTCELVCVIHATCGQAAKNMTPLLSA